MEYIQHGDLDQYLKTPDARPNAREITRQLLEGLTVLHERKICHRDLKPQNILIAPPSPIWVKIADFGGSKISKGTELHTRLGMQGYFAPEILGILPGMPTKNPYTDVVDMWALGSVVHKTLTLRTPFSEDLGYSTTIFSGIQQLPANPEQTDMRALLDFCLGKTEFPTEALKQSGASAHEISFVMSLLVANPKSRISASHALQSPWMLESHDMIDKGDFSQLAISLQNRKPDKDLLASSIPKNSEGTSRAEENGIQDDTQEEAELNIQSFEQKEGSLKCGRISPGRYRVITHEYPRKTSQKYLELRIPPQNRKALDMLGFGYHLTLWETSTPLFVAASVYEFNTDTEEREDGFPYLKYDQGELFDVIWNIGDFWLAKCQGHVNGELGWIWSKHFVRLLE